MKKGLILMGLVLMVGIMAQPADAAGGMKPCLASCCLGPRVGLEMNEGKPVETLEIVGLFIPIVRIVPGLQNAGFPGCVFSFLFGPRVGAQLNERKVRTMEILQLVVVGRIIISLEAKGGKTMSEIEEAEGLKK